MSAALIFTNCPGCFLGYPWVLKAKVICYYLQGYLLSSHCLWGHSSLSLAGCVGELGACWCALELETQVRLNVGIQSYNTSLLFIKEEVEEKIEK